MTDKIILAGDIGGTKTTLGLFKQTAGLHVTLAEATFPSASYPSLESITGQFLARVDEKIDVASFALAGVVTGNKAKITNLPWTVDAASFGNALGLRSVGLMNDLEATANAVPMLTPADFYTLNDTPAATGGAIGVIAPGTGLGEAFLTREGTAYRAHPSEGGHCSFAPRTPLEVELLGFLMERFEHVSYERVCSGQGIANLYAFFRERRHMEERPCVAEQLAATSDPTPVIVGAALDPENPSPLCRRTLETFVSILGAEAGNLALKVLATGGIYLGGGIPPRILPVLQEGQFMRTYRHKGRFGAMVAQMPVYVIVNSKAALFGAALAGFHRL